NPHHRARLESRRAVSTIARIHSAAMTLPTIILSTGLAFVFLAFIFIPLEKAFPARRQEVFRPAWLTDLAFFAGQYFVWSALVLATLTHFHGWLDGLVPAAFRARVAAQPWWLQAGEVVLLSDLFIYWGHRLQHRVGFLW